MNIFMLPDGMYKLIVNTKNRWCDYRVNIDYTTIKFYELDDDGNDVAIWSTINPFPVGVRFLRYDQQEKDQVVMIFIPTDLLLEAEEIEV